MIRSCCSSSVELWRLCIMSAISFSRVSFKSSISITSSLFDIQRLSERAAWVKGFLLLSCFGLAPLATAVRTRALRENMWWTFFHQNWRPDLPRRFCVCGDLLHFLTRFVLMLSLKCKKELDRVLYRSYSSHSLIRIEPGRWQLASLVTSARFGRTDHPKKHDETCRSVLQLKWCHYSRINQWHDSHTMYWTWLRTSAWDRGQVNESRNDLLWEKWPTLTRFWSFLITLHHLKNNTPPIHCLSHTLKSGQEVWERVMEKLSTFSLPRSETTERAVEAFQGIISG